MCGEEDYVAACPGNLDQNVLHLHLADRRGSAEIVFLPFAPETLELGLDIFLSLSYPFRGGRPRTDFHQLSDVLECALAVKSAGLLRRRSCIPSLKRSGRGGRRRRSCRLRFAGSLIRTASPRRQDQGPAAQHPAHPKPYPHVRALLREPSPFRASA